MRSKVKTQSSIAKLSYNVTSILFFLIGMYTNTIQSQHRHSTDNKNIITVGINIIDDSYTSKHQSFNREEWNITKYPSYFSYNRAISDKISIEGAFSFNKYKISKLVDGNYIKENKDYAAMDLSLKYNFLNGLNTNSNFLANFSPFIMAGLGTTSKGNQQYANINYGAGFYYWFNSSDNCNCSIKSSSLGTLGLIFQTMGKSSFDNKQYGNYIQHSMGIAYRF